MIFLLLYTIIILFVLLVPMINRNNESRCFLNGEWQIEQTQEDETPITLNRNTLNFNSKL
jgi:hypothetical protein